MTLSVVRLVVSAAMLLTISGCGTPSSSQIKISEMKSMMGTLIKIDVCASKEVDRTKIEGAFEKVWERLAEIAWRMNVMDENSDVAKINRSEGEPVKLGADTIYVIERSFKFHQWTGGAFDVTVWPLIILWKNSEKSNLPPAENEIDSVLENIGIHHFQFIDQEHMQRNNANAYIDLGGIAKGYSVDEAARIFREMGVPNFLIDAGGDMYAGGTNCHGDYWRIGIRDPLAKDSIALIVEISDRSVTTSGDYERYFTIGSKKYSHIFDPRTGRPAEKAVSATVIAETALDADALSTAISVLGAEEGTRLIDALEGDYASLIMVQDDSGELRQIKSASFIGFQPN